MKEAYLKLILWAYLHDMGKLLWRGGVVRKKKKYEIAHAQYVADFFSQDQFSPFWKEVWLLASLHHYKDFKAFKNWDFFSNPEEGKSIAWTIYMADNISSMERIDEENLEESNDVYIKNFGLRTVFENIFSDTGLTNKRFYFPETLHHTDFQLSDMGDSFEGARFDAKIIKGVDGERVKMKFENLAQNFMRALENLALRYPFPTQETTKKLMYSLDMLLQNYFTLVPSDAYKSIGDISLYDHTKTTVAIASVLYASGYHLKTYKYESWDTETAKVCREEIGIIAWDFPSIQKYLFSSLKKYSHLAKRLRMKSMTIQLLNEAVIEYLLTQLGLSRANVLMNAGGKFVILVPKLPDQAIFENLKASINDFLLLKYWTVVKLALTHTQLQIREVFDIQWESIDTKQFFENLFRQLSLQKFSVYTTDQLIKIFQTPDVSGKKLCSYCGLSYLDLESEPDCCKHCQDEIDGGANLTHYPGVSIRYQEGDDFAFEIKWSNESSPHALYISFNDWEFEHSQLATLPKSINVHIPKHDSWEPQTFTDLVQDNKRNYLCMLKGDIDNMSILLKYGFEYQDKNGNHNSIYSVSRLVQMSRMLELFFWKHLMRYLQLYFPQVYTVFSGGDDFIFILPFQQRYKFINSLYKAFSDFVAHNEKLHFSLGLQIFKDKTPLVSVDHQAEILLKQAKQASKLHLTKNSLSKRCIALYDPHYVLVKKDSAFDLFQDVQLTWAEKVSDTLLYQRYLELSEMMDIAVEHSSSEYVKRGARLLYSITRNISDKVLRKSILEDIAPIQNPLEKKKLRKILLQMTDVLYQKRV